MNLFLDTSNKYLIIILENNNKIIDNIFIDGDRKHTEQTIEKIEELFQKNNINWNLIKNIYTTSGPGSYTGVRVGLTIAKTIKIINKSINIYEINSLYFQAGLNNVVSLLDAKSNKYYSCTFENGKKISDISLKDVNKIENINNHKKIVDYKNIDYIKNFLDLKNKFNKINDINNFKIKYYKNIF